MRIARRMLLVAGVSVLTVTSSGLAEAAKPQTGAGAFTVGEPSTRQTCSNLGFATPDPSDDSATPDGGAHCDVATATVDAATRTLTTDTAASTTTPADPTGLSASGQGRAVARAGLYFNGDMTGKPPSQVHITVPVDSIDSTSRAVGTTSGRSYLFVYAWTYNSYTNDSSWELITTSPLPPNQTVGEKRTIELDLAGSKLRGDIRLRVEAYSSSDVGYINCTDGDDADTYCDPETITTHDGSGTASSTATVRVGVPTFVAS